MTSKLPVLKIISKERSTDFSEKLDIFTKKDDSLQTKSSKCSKNWIFLKFKNARNVNTTIFFQISDIVCKLTQKQNEE